MHIIGFAGKSGAGKTAAAGMLAMLLVHMGYSVKLDTFADPVRKDAIKHFGSIDEDCFEQRAWMQDKAAEIRGRSPWYFVNQFILRNNLDVAEYAEKWEPADFLIVHDLRMPNEVEYCSTHGVVVFMMGTHKPLPEELAGHGSETAIDGLLHGADYFITKQPDLDHLAAAVLTMVKEGRHIKNNQGEGASAFRKEQNG